MLVEYSQDRTKVVYVIVQGLAVDQDVVEENQYKTTKEWPEYIVHKTLEGRRSVGETKWHNEEFIVALVRAKRSLRDVLGFHSDLVITRT